MWSGENKSLQESGIFCSTKMITKTKGHHFEPFRQSATMKIFLNHKKVSLIFCCYSEKTSSSSKILSINFALFDFFSKHFLLSLTTAFGFSCFQVKEKHSFFSIFQDYSFELSGTVNFSAFLQK